MLELLKKGYLLGLGLASLTRERVEEAVDDLVRRGELAEKDRPSVVNDLVTRMKEEQKKLSNSFRETAQKVIAEKGVPSRQQFDELVSRVEKLEKAAQSRKKPAEHDQTP